MLLECFVYCSHSYLAKASGLSQPYIAAVKLLFLSHGILDFLAAVINCTVEQFEC